MTKHDNKVYLRHILEAIEKIETYIGRQAFSEFKKDKQLIDAVIRNFEIIGEASNRIPDEFRAKYPEIDFGSAIGMRHRVIHGYDEVNLDFIWSTTKKDLPVFKKQVEKILKETD